MIEGICLSAFITVAEECSFSRAADRLGITQSVVSKRLRRLEDQLGGALLDRSVRSDIHLTRAGKLFLPDARDALDRLETAERAGRNLNRGNTGPLRVGFVFSAAMNGTLSKMLSAVKSGFPDILLEPQLLETPEQLSALQTGRLDIALVRPRPSYPIGCNAHVVHTEPLLVCMSSDHPQANKTSLQSRQLSKERFVVPQFHEQVGLIDSIRRLAKVGKFEMPQIVRTDDFVTAVCLAAAGEGVVLAPASLCRLGLDGIVFRAIDDYKEGLSTILVHRYDAPKEAFVSALAGLGVLQGQAK